MKKILLLGSGELGKELTISLKRIGCHVVACDAYDNAPAMQVSDQFEVFNMIYFDHSTAAPYTIHLYEIFADFQASKM